MADAPATPRSGFARFLDLLRPGREHSARSATILVMVAVAGSRLLGFVRESYIAWAFGAGKATAAYLSAFTIPNIFTYMLAGGSVSTTFITIYSRFVATNQREKGEHFFDVVVTVMSAVFAVLIIVGEIFSAPLCRLMFPGMAADELRETISMTRILLPMELCMYIGSLVQGLLYARKLFLVPAVTPIVYNLGIIGGGLALSRVVGVHALAIGALTGAVIGPLGMATAIAMRAGMRFRPSLDTKDAAFREWAILTLPLMVGLSLVSVDEWITRVVAAGAPTAVSRLNYAKRLFGVPSAVLNQAIGIAQLPFFAQLFAQKRWEEYGKIVNDAVSKSVAASLLLSSLMVTCALPAVDLVYRRGAFTFEDSVATGLFFLVFSIGLCFWPAQGLYSRAFYSANDTLTPMIATTIITLVSLPVYWKLYSSWGPVGLCVASDIGICGNTLSLAWLLHRKGYVRIGGLAWGEIARAVGGSLVAGLAAFEVTRLLPLQQSRLGDLEQLAIVFAVWSAIVAGVLVLTGSSLPRDLLRRRKPAG